MRTNSKFSVRVGNANAGLRNSGFSFDGGTSGLGKRQPGGVTVAARAANANATRVVWSRRARACIFLLTTATLGLSRMVTSGARVGSDRVVDEFYGFANGTFYVSTNGGASFSNSGATDFRVPANSKQFPGEAVTSGWRAARKVAPTVCGIQRTLAPPSRGWPMCRKRTTSVSGWPLPGKPTWRSIPARRSIMSAVSSVRTTPVSVGCGSMTTSTNMPLRAGRSLVTQEFTGACI